mmetsp:Transcript_85363/g.242072  ORF Transcript_85363/g.242072 Transcript_85363/m.242072 type:complete len:182 (+) Transcript_85363:85-630(+)
MPRVHFSVGEDEATMLTVFVKGLEADVEVEEGQTVEFAKNRAIDQLSPKVPFCHAMTALCTLRLFDAASCAELTGDERAEDGMRLLLGHEPPSEQPGEVPAASAALAGMFSEAAKKKLGPAVEPVKPAAAAGPPAPRAYTLRELRRLSVKELRGVIEGAGGSWAGCIEKSDLVEAASRFTS